MQRAVGQGGDQPMPVDESVSSQDREPRVVVREQQARSEIEGENRGTEGADERGSRRESSHDVHSKSQPDEGERGQKHRECERELLEPSAHGYSRGTTRQPRPDLRRAAQTLRTRRYGDLSGGLQIGKL